MSTTLPSCGLNSPANQSISAELGAKNVEPCSSDTSLNVDFFNHLAFNVANNSESVQNNDDNLLSVDCEVDDILRLLDENNNESNNCDMSDGYLHNITSSAETTFECDSDIRLTELDSNSNYHNDFSAHVLSTGIF